PHVVVLRDADFTDEEREHDAYSVGDDIGLVRVGASGGVSVRIVPKAEQPGRWRRLKHSLSDDDEVVAVDGDPGAALLVVTHEREDACGGRGSAEGVRAIRVDMRGDDDAVFELAPADCERAPGPFWISSTGSEQVVAWVERRPPGGLPRSAPIRGVAFRVVRPDGARASRILQAADAVVDAGCDDTGCSLAALVRPPDSDGMQPAPIRLFAYPR
ncbi:MAG TPA: hypothetical protein VE987_04130, partial [Polyangiaceae bacterium]|nr:hypothetical protein [Polyangiaceae bacterium]